MCDCTSDTTVEFTKRQLRDWTRDYSSTWNQLTGGNCCRFLKVSLPLRPVHVLIKTYHKQRVIYFHFLMFPIVLEHQAKPEHLSTDLCNLYLRHRCHPLAGRLTHFTNSASMEGLLQFYIQKDEMQYILPLHFAWQDGCPLFNVSVVEIITKEHFRCFAHFEPGIVVSNKPHSLKKQHIIHKEAFVTAWLWRVAGC